MMLRSQFGEYSLRNGCQAIRFGWKPLASLALEFAHAFGLLAVETPV
jgi:hypothetical protein